METFRVLQIFAKDSSGEIVGGKKEEKRKEAEGSEWVSELSIKNE